MPDFYQRLQQPEPILIDGAMGTEIFRLVPDHRGPLEILNSANPAVVEEIHRNYINAGAMVIETNTFGGSAIKLAEYGIGDRCEELNETGALLARRAASGRSVFVAGSIGPTGKLIEPIGDACAEEVLASFKSQCRGLARGGVDLIIIETMNDIQEAKLAVLAARDTGLPVLCSLTFEENGRTVTGTDMVTALASASSFGANIVGANCSMGPEGLLSLFTGSIDELKRIGVPLSAWANAGLPVLHEGRGAYTLPPEEFARRSMAFVDLGIQIIGGCCGTTPEHIAALNRHLADAGPREKRYGKRYIFITSRAGRLDLEKRGELIAVGERLNPSARKAFAQELKEGKQTFLRAESKKQETEGADILDINVGVPAIDEAAAMRRSVHVLTQTVTVPLMIDSENRAVIESALLAYPGVPVLNSINGKKESLAAILPLVKRYGCFVIALCLDESGIHRDSARRIAIGEKLLQILNAEGIVSERIFIDPLILTESAEPGSAMETLKVIEHFAKKGIKTSIGLSNISFGLPERKHINSAFLKMAVEKGLTAAILNPGAVRVQGDFTEEERLAAAFLTGDDPGAKKYIERFKKPEAGEKKAPVAEKTDRHLSGIYGMVVDGNSDDIADAVKNAVQHETPERIMDSALISGLDAVGDLYSSGRYFLPQMIASANAMKRGFSVLKPLLSRKASESPGRVVICTVKGDIHDIGKNIVAMMLENHGFEVFDLGKDVPAGAIVEKAKDVQAHIVCLSSLLTTTMNEMRIVREALRRENPSVSLIIGGAVVNQEYASQIDALYGRDAVDGVLQAKRALGLA